MNNGSLNGHAERTKLALEVQAEALRPTPPLSGPSLLERLANSERRVRDLQAQVAQLQHRKRVNENEFKREKARQRMELGINDEISVNAAQQLTAGRPSPSLGASNL